MKIRFLIGLIITCTVSCKKRDSPACVITTAQIAGHYKLTKLESVSYNTGIAQDLTSTLTNCELSGIYNFNNDNTATYSELVNCNGSSSGTWALSETWLITSFTSGIGNRINGTLIESWNCSILVLTTQYPSVNFNYRFTLRRL